MGGQSHFPDCLVLRERGEASTSRALAPPRPQTFPLAPLRSQWQSWVTAVESINGGLGSEATSLSGVRADGSSLIPLWDQNPRRRRRQSSTIFYLERELELQKRDKAAVFVIHGLTQRYLCCPPRRLLTSLAFGLLDCCTSAPPPAAEGNGVRRQRPRPELHFTGHAGYLQIAQVGLQAPQVRQNLSAEGGQAACLGHQGESGVAAGVEGAASRRAQVPPCRRGQDVVVRAALSGAAVTLQHQISCCENREREM